MEKIIIFGSGKIGSAAYEYIQDESAFEVVAFTANREHVSSDRHLNRPLVPFEEVETRYPPDAFKMLIAVGYQNLNKFREQRFMEAKAKGYRLVSFVHSKASIAKNVSIGENCFICEFNSIQPFCEIGDNVFIWPNNHVSHHSKIKGHSWITAGVIVSGSVTIEPHCFVGVNSAIGHEIVIGAESFIGAGSIIVKSTDEKSVYIAPSTEKFKLDSDSFIRFAKF